MALNVTRRKTQLLLVVFVAAGAAGAVWLWAHPNPTKLLDRGLALGRRDSTAGERLLRQAIIQSGGHYADAEMALCLLLAGRNEWSAAQAQFATLDKETCRTDLLLEFGRSALEASRETEALEALQSVRRRRNRDSAAALESLIQVFLAWGQIDEVIDAAREWTELDPDDARPWIRLIQALKNQERRDAECLNAVRQALTRDLPDDVQRELRHRLVEQLIVCGDVTGARRELWSLLESEQESFRLRLLQMDLHRLEGRPDKALELMEQVFAEARDPAEACFNRSVIYHDLGRYADAARDLERTIAAQPLNATAQFKLSEAYRALGRQDLARRHREIADGINAKKDQIASLERQIHEKRTDAAILNQLAELHRALGNDDLARSWQERADRLTGPSGK
jgi:tetratricopeptide (TPR) repeat protein